MKEGKWLPYGVMGLERCGFDGMVMSIYKWPFWFCYSSIYKIYIYILLLPRKLLI